MKTLGICAATHVPSRAPIRTLTVECRKRSTQRATDQADPPPDPWQRRRQQRPGSPPPSSSSPPPPPPPNTSYTSNSRNKEPLDFELLILFGLPALIIIIPAAVKEPAFLALIPFAFIVPGVRDVLFAVLRALPGARKERKKRNEWAPRRPPPPPPPSSGGVPPPVRSAL